MNKLKELLNSQKPLLDERDAQGNIPQQTLGARIPKDLHHRLKIFAAKENRTIAEVVTTAIATYLNDHQTKASSLD